MIFDPVNSITNLDFYKRISGQSLGRSFLYICYLGIVFSVFTTLALKVKVEPVLAETFTWLERSMPPLTYENGRVTSTQPGPTKIQHPKLPEVTLLIDTNRSEAVTPQLMEEEKVLGYLTATSFYLRQQNGRMEVYDLTKSAQGAKPVTIDAGFYRNARLVMGRILYPVALFVTFFIFLAWKGVASLVYSLAALMINALAGGGLGYAQLLNVAIYAQTLVVLLQIATLFLPFVIPGFQLLGVAVTCVYIWLAVKRHSSDSSSPSALPA
jgi:hypothetical protein